MSYSGRKIQIADRLVGYGEPCLIIAEAGVNHNGDLALACQLVDMATQAGADVVKFQTFSADRLVTSRAPKANYQLRTTSPAESHLDMLRSLELSQKDLENLFGYCRERNILFMSSPFDEQSADVLADLGVAAFKIPSGEITNLSFLSHVAHYKKPMFVSTGMAYLSEVEAAVRTLEEANNSDFVLLQCVSNYPADPADANLRAMSTMAKAFGAPVGYSDHTPGIEVPLAAVALGACAVEKHITVDRNLAGPDHLASLEGRDLATLVLGIRTVEAALGHGRKEPAPSEADTAAAARKSLVSGEDIPSGTLLTKQLISVKRPGTGLPPSILPYIVGRVVRVAIPKDTLITLEMLL